jgi:hypothetical protein
MEGRLEASAEGLVRVEARVEESSCREKMCWFHTSVMRIGAGWWRMDGLLYGCSVCGLRDVAAVNSDEARG